MSILSKKEINKTPRFRSVTKKFDGKNNWKFDENATYSEIDFSENWKKYRGSEYDQYRKDWSDIPRRKKETRFPLHLDIETTTFCNLKCPMCSRTEMVAKGEFEERGFMTRKEFKKIIDEGKKYNLRSIKLNYLGEPLMHKDVFWQVEYAKKNDVIDVTMNSNGTALNINNGKALLEAGLDGMFISFDAVNPKDYETQRVGTTIGRTIDNLYNFSKLRDKIRPGCKIRVSMVMYDDPKWMEQYKALQVMWRGIVDSVGYSWFVEHNKDVQVEHPKNPDFYCAQLYHRMFLKNNGNVTVCCFDESDQVVVGNWKLQTLSEIWNGEIYKSIRSKHSNGNYYDIEMCRKCYFPVSNKQNHNSVNGINK